MEKKNDPIIKADDFVQYEDEVAKFTNFQELQMKFEVLQDVVEELTEIIRANDLTRTKIIQAPYFDYEEIYRRLEDDMGQ